MGGSGVYLVGVVVYALSAATAVTHAMLYKRDPRSVWGWIAACWLIPIGGALLYFLFGINRIEARARRWIGAPAPIDFPDSQVLPAPTPQMGSIAIKDLARIGEMMSGWPLTAGNEIDPLFNGEQAYPAMLAAIAAARRRIDLSTYIYFDDETGRQFAAALSQASQRGVEVRILLDGVADAYYRPRGSRLLQRNGLQPVLFLPLRWFPPMFHVNLRNHRKLLIVDGETAFTGGMNIARHHLASDPSGHVKEDIHFRIRGPLVSQMSAAFSEGWHYATGAATSLPKASPSEHGQAIGRVVVDGPNEDADKLMLLVIGALSVAHGSVRIMTPYLTPGHQILSAMQSAALRGVDLSIILPERSNQPWADWATRKLLVPLLQHQVRVYYRPPPFAHTKLLLIDDQYVQFGSANLDTRSLRLNFELVVEAYDRDLAGTLTEHFETVRKVSQPVTVEQIESRSLPIRLRDAFFWLFSPFY